ncbi:MAG: YcjF family protein [Opitutaceae bacterium]|jgi:uncharacterized protein (DUF697 family)|nr:YcjF family protein [Opitutaceae bacterium]
MKKSDKLLAKLNQSLAPEKEAPTPTVSSPSPKRNPRKPRPKKPAAPPKTTRRKPAATAPAPALSPIPEPPPAASPPDRAAQARDLVNQHLGLSLGAGMIPMPIVDVVAISGIQLKLITELSRLYDVPFTRHRAQAILLSLFAGVGSFSLATGVFGSLLKTLPGAGSLLGAATLPVTATALTYAVGHVFIEHFETGGTLLDFDTTTAKRKFEGLVAEGREKWQNR